MARTKQPTTIYRIAHRDKPYSQIGNAMIRDKRLTCEARFALIFILSHPTNWKLSQEWLSRELDMGRDKTYRIVHELIRFEYCVRRQTRDANGKHGAIEYYFTDEPGSIVLEPLPDFQEAVTPDVVVPRPGLPDTAKPRPVKPTPTNKGQSQTNIGKQKRREGSSASAGTDAASAAKWGVTQAVLDELISLGVDVDKLLARYAARTKGKAVRDPSAYLLSMGRDEAAKRFGVTAEQVKGTTSRSRTDRITAATGASNAYSRPSDAALKSAQTCAHLPEILAMLSKQSFATQAQCDAALRMEVVNARFRPPGKSLLTGELVPSKPAATDEAA